MRSSGWSPQRISALAYGGRLVVISAVGARVLDIDLIDVYRNDTRILGSDSRKLGVVESACLLELISPYFESEAFRPLPISLSARRRRRSFNRRALAGDGDLQSQRVHSGCCSENLYRPAGGNIAGLTDNTQPPI
jgi:hypothetical protein